MLGVLGRASRQLRLAVTRRNGRSSLQPLVESWTQRGCSVYTDEWVAYDLLPQGGRKRASVKHCRPNAEFARDDDGDGIREVHCNGLEGIWTGLRNFLRPFRGVAKTYLSQYVGMFQWSCNIKCICDQFMRSMLATPTEIGS